MEKSANEDKVGDGPPEVQPLLQAIPLQGLHPPSPGIHDPPQEAYSLSPKAPAITNQPTSQGIRPDDWMPMPRVIPSSPPGLEYLALIDQLLVHQTVELLEAFTGFQTANRYTIKNSLGQKVFYAGEVSDCCTRNCCGPIRPFDMKILDNFGNEVMHLYRPLACDSCWFPCCLQRIEVTAPPGTVIGVVEQQWSILFPRFAIKNPAGETLLRIAGPFCTSSCCCGDVEFKVLSADGETEVGKISKQWSGLGKEIFTDADNFGISFPMDLDVTMKATMLGACFLIDMMFFEGMPRNNDPGTK